MKCLSMLFVMALCLIPVSQASGALFAYGSFCDISVQDEFTGPEYILGWEEYISVGLDDYCGYGAVGWGYQDPGIIALFEAADIPYCGTSTYADGSIDNALYWQVSYDSGPECPSESVYYHFSPSYWCAIWGYPSTYWSYLVTEAEGSPVQCVGGYATYSSGI